LALRNFGKMPAEMAIDLRLQGKPLAASGDAKILLDTTNLKLLERTGTVSWRLTLKPGEAVKLTYTYERYVPSH